MEIKNQWPPNIEDIRKVFDLKGFRPVFIYDGKLYNPYGLPIAPDLMIHEQVHEKQQSGMGAENWWKLYLTNKQFRLEQEVEAYQAQAKYVEANYNRKDRKILRKEFPRHLSSKLYGNLINKQQAEEIIYG